MLDIQSIQQLMVVLDKFVDVSSLRANQLKSCIYFGGVSKVVKHDILKVSGMVDGKLPFKYLGVPLSTQNLSVMQCQPLVQKILQRINCWAAKLLTYADRVQLIKFVLFGVQMYWSRIFVLPQKVLKLVQAACRTFLWIGRVEPSKRAIVAWDKVMLPK